MKIKEYYRRMVEWMEKHNIERKFRITYDIIANIVSSWLSQAFYCSYLPAASGQGTSPRS